MAKPRAFMLPAERYDVPRLLHEWQWLLPPNQSELFVTVLGDWVFGAPGGSLWCLSLLEGTYTQIAANSGEYNRFKQSPDWMSATFSSEWQPIGEHHGLFPTNSECLGWRLHPRIGGKFTSANLQVFDMAVYQSLMGQLHRQLTPQAEAVAAKPGLLGRLFGRK
ncbi:MAG: hypothetical protein ABJD97_21130 [Betaproteobacteria bacterium]